MMSYYMYRTKKSELLDQLINELDEMTKDKRLAYLKVITDKYKLLIWEIEKDEIKKTRN